MLTTRALSRGRRSSTMLPIPNGSPTGICGAARSPLLRPRESLPWQSHGVPWARRLCLGSVANVPRPCLPSPLVSSFPGPRGIRPQAHLGACLAPLDGRMVTVCKRGKHAPGCRPGRPRCAAMRAKNRKWKTCNCGCYHYPHRKGSKLCREGLNALAYGPDPNAPQPEPKEIGL